MHNAIITAIQNLHETRTFLNAGYSLDEKAGGAIHCYTTKENAFIFARLRFKNPATGKKEIRPIHKKDSGDWVIKAAEFTDGTPLYNLHDICSPARQAETVVLVEGERCVDLLIACGILATTSGGAQSAEKADWAPLAGRNVLIWPDNDPAGIKYAEQAAAKLKKQGCTLSQVDVAALDLPEKGDCVDWLASFREKNSADATAQDIWALSTVTLNETALEKNAVVDSTNEEEEKIQELASLSSIEYDRIRKEKAKILGIRVTLLDKMVMAIRSNKNKANSCPFKEVEPSSEPINPAQLLDDISETIREFIILDMEQANALALWVALTWFIDCIEIFPLAIINAPEKSCGKTQLLTVLSRISYRPLPASNASPSALFRAISAWQPTIFIDEADTFFQDNTELQGMVNAGHSRDGYVLRTESIGDSFEPRSYPVFSAKAIAGINLEKHLPDATMSRGIIFNLRRKLQHETVSRLRHANTIIFSDLGEKLARFAEDFADQVKQARPILPEALNDRDQDNWEGLLAIASCADEAWLEKAITAALKLSYVDEKPASIANELLADIQQLFEKKNRDKIKTAELIEALCEEEEAPWATYNRGKPITPRQVSHQLKAYGVTSKNIRFSSHETAKGFERSQFLEVFMRYLSTHESLPTQRHKLDEGMLGEEESVADNPQHNFIRHKFDTLEARPVLDCVVVSDEMSVLRGVAKVICKNCLHFQAASPGVDGIGQCSVDGWKKGEPSLYPHALRTCEKFQSPQKANTEGAKNICSNGILRAQP